jgi:hypothetical protein
MRRAARLLGIVGGALGAILGIALLAIEGQAGLTDAPFVVLVCGLAGIVGGMLAIRHRVISAVLLVVPGVGGLFATPYYWALPALLLCVGGVLVAVSRTGPDAPEPPPLTATFDPADEVGFSVSNAKSRRDFQA